MITKTHPNFKMRYRVFTFISFILVVGFCYRPIMNAPYDSIGTLIGGLVVFLILIWAYKNVTANFLKCPDCSSRLILNPHQPDIYSTATCKECLIKWNLEIVFKSTSTSNNDDDFDWHSDND